MVYVLIRMAHGGDSNDYTEHTITRDVRNELLIVL